MRYTSEKKISLFDGSTLKGWHAAPRHPVPPWPGGPDPDPNSDAYRRVMSNCADWRVEDSAIVGRQDPPGSELGGYLISDDVFSDFQLTLEVKPDWPADTGIMVRATPLGSQGFQILVDHRQSGGIGGFYGNGIGGFHALNFNVDVERDELGTPINLIEEDPATTIEPITNDKRAMLKYAAPASDFFEVWRWNDWNEISIRCVERLPILTTWVNGVKLNELDTSKIVHPHYDAEKVAELLGASGHIALEVHDNDPSMGAGRWAPDAAVRWRNIELEELELSI